jgi:uncharacterized BrkB/YihY/UPF0761 family membrane protein
MEHTELAAPNPTPSRRIWARVAVSLAGVLGLYVAPFAYFLTACTSAIDVTQRIEWLAFMVVLVPVIYPAYVAVAAVAVFALVFALANSDRAVRIRNVVLPSLVAGIVVLSLAYGLVEPTKCSIF